MDEEVGFFGGEHSSARLISEAQNAKFWSYSFGSLDSAPTTGLHMTARITPFSMVLSIDAAVLCGEYQACRLQQALSRLT